MRPSPHLRVLNEGTGHIERFDPRPGGEYRIVITYDRDTHAGFTATLQNLARFVERA